jgi:hypothetical protein
MASQSPSFGQLLPTIVAGVVAAGMLWLAGEPFTLVEGGARTLELPAIPLQEPRGDLEAFPVRFQWQPVRGADLYEITVAREDAAEMLFRQRGNTTLLELDWDSGDEPPPGDYVWEVIATRKGFPVAAGAGTFSVRSPDGPPPVPGGQAAPRPAAP